MSAFLLLLRCTATLGGVPECHAYLNECMKTYNPRFADLVNARREGDSSVVRNVRENQDEFCDLDNWVKRSEVCGPCAYTFEFTSGVPQRYTGVQHCIGYTAKSPYIEDSNLDIASPYNGREMRVVTHPPGGGCSTADYGGANLTDTIAFYNFMESFGCGGGYAGGARIHRQLGNRLSVVMYTFHNRKTEGEMPHLRPSSRGIEDVVLMQALGGANDLPILSLLRAAPLGEQVRGKITYHCGEGQPRGNPPAADLSQYGGGSCPWIVKPGDCGLHPDPAKRLCLDCPLVMSDALTGEELACLWEPDLRPMRSHNSMAEALAWPLREKVLYINRDALPTPDHLCDFEAWDADLYRGRIVAFTPPMTSLVCSRRDYAFHMMRVGVRAWILPGFRLQGEGQNVRLPIGCVLSPSAGTSIRSRFADKGVQVGPFVYEVDLEFRVPEAPPPSNTTAPPKRMRRDVTVDTELPDLMEDPVAVLGAVMIPVALIAIVAKLVSARARSVPLPPARGVPLGLTAILLSAVLSVILVSVTFLLARAAGADAEEAQKLNKDEAVQVMVMRESAIMNGLTSLYLKTAGNTLFVAFSAILGRMEEDIGVAKSFASFGDEEETYDNWHRRFQNVLIARQNKGGTSTTTGVQLQMYVNGWYFDELGVENDPAAPMLNGTEVPLRVSNQPLLHPLWHQLSATHFDSSVYDPFKRLWWTDLPVADVFALENHPHFSPKLSLQLYLGEYQVISRVAEDTQGTVNAPYLTGTVSMRGRGFGVASVPADYLANMMKAAIASEAVRSPLAENMTFVVHTEDGVIITADIDRHDAWRTVDHYGDLLRGGTQRGFQLFTLFDSLQWEFNAYAHFVLSKHGRLDAKDESGEVIVDTFTAGTHYRGHRTEWMHFPFDGAVAETGWHVWDTWMVCQGGGAGCSRFENGHAGHKTGQSLYLDGTGEVRVSPYLTQRVPRVAQRRVGGVAGYQSTLDYYNHTLPWGGVSDVIVTQRNLRPSVQGERWQPVVRDRVFHKSDYSVSVWVRRAAPGNKGTIFTDSLSPEANLRVYEDGSVVISIISYGCRTAPLRDLTAGKWAFLALTVRFARRRQVGFCTVYLDGKRRTKSPLGTLALPYVAHNYTIGHGFTGHIQDLRVHNETLSSHQIRALIATGDAKSMPQSKLTFALHTASQAMSLARPNKQSMMAVILPQEDIVRESEANSARMTRVISQQDRITQDNLQRKHTALGLLISGVALFGILVTITFHLFLARPFALFAREILRVSQADVEGIVKMQENSSLLQEINIMGGAINQLVDNMREYKTFMPDAIFEPSPPIQQVSLHEAPGLATGQAAVVFTDISGSTALWELCPEAMAASLRIHNATVRDVIHTCGGYEVKTIGDAFMVAFPDLSTAVQFSLEAQEALGRAAWPEDLLELPQCRRDIKTGYRGLRVRMGCAAGAVTVELNAVLQHYDYFGPTVNRAARLESHGQGGGVVVETEVASKLPNAQLGHAVSVTLGTHTLKGIQQAVSLSLLVPQSLGQALEDNNNKVDNPLARADSVSCSASSSSSTRSRHNTLVEHLLEIKAATVGFIDVVLYDGLSVDLTAQANLQMSRVITGLGRTDGRLVNVCGTAVLVSWNVISPCSGHIEGALRFAVIMGVGQQKMPCGLCCGKAYSGSIGTKGRRFVTAVGRCVQISFTAFASAQRDGKGLMLATDDSAVSSALVDRNLAMPAGQISTGAQPCPVYEVDCAAVSSRLPHSKHGLFGREDD